MRYVEGSDSRSVLAEEGRSSPRVPSRSSTQVASASTPPTSTASCTATSSPATSLSRAPGRREHVYLTDFGLTKRAERRAEAHEAGQFLGTIDYVAPEQIEGRKMDGRADRLARRASSTSA